MTTYTATATREGDWLVLDVDLGPGAITCTQARDLAEADVMVRDVVAIVLDVAPDSFDVEIVGP